MKILMIMDSLVKGGKERRLVELLKGFSKCDDIECELVLFSKKIDYKEVFELNIPIHILERKPKKDPRVFLKLYQICKRVKPDIAHSWGNMSSIYVIPSTKALGIKLLSGNISNATNTLRWYDQRSLRTRFTFPFSDVVVGNSKAGLKAYGAPAHKSYCIYNGFDFNRLDQLDDKGKLREKLGLQPGKVVGMVGAFFNRKDYCTFLKAACILLEEGLELNFMAVGDGPNRRKLESTVPDRFKNRIHFTGLVDRVESMVNLFDVAILTTNTKVHLEGISNSIIEYLVLEKPVIATKGGGTNEIIIPEETGILIPPDDPQALSVQIKRLLKDKILARKLGKKGKALVYERFSLVRMQKEYRTLYYQLINGTLDIRN